jgi:hypothetical protein
MPYRLDSYIKIFPLISATFWYKHNFNFKIKKSVLVVYVLYGTFVISIRIAEKVVSTMFLKLKNTNKFCLLQFTVTNSSIFGVDPTDPTYLYVNTNYLSFYKGQTSIIRFNLTMDEYKYYIMSFALSSNLTTDQFELIRFFVVNIGDNFCSSLNPVLTYTNGYSFLDT